METSGIISFVISCAIGFGLVRTFVHFRDKKRNKRKQALEAQALRDRLAEPESLNKAKRKRQLQQLEKEAKSQKR